MIIESILAGALVGVFAWLFYRRPHRCTYVTFYGGAYEVVPGEGPTRHVEHRICSECGRLNDSAGGALI